MSDAGIFPVVIRLVIFLLFFGRLLLSLQAQESESFNVISRIRTLGEVPEWSALTRFDGCLTANEFQTMMDSIYSPGNPWQTFFKLENKRVELFEPGEHVTAPFLSINLALSASYRNAVPKYWKSREELLPPSNKKPLQGLHVVLDPGHIGGIWGTMERRHFQIGDDPPVQEGDLTLKTARILKLMLESLGARVTLLRWDNNPVTVERPETLMDEATVLIDRGYRLPGISSNWSRDTQIKRSAELLFYRISEIRARADIVNQQIRPDVVLALHYNAEPWPDPGHHTLVDRNHFHILINGSYSMEELRHHDERFEMLTKLLAGAPRVEIELAQSIAGAFDRMAGLSPFTYTGNNAHRVGGNPFVWSRNLLANRLYRCPVIYLEPYVANNKTVYARIQAGDFAGRKQINGQEHISLFREYARAVVAGMVEYYGTRW